MKITYQKDVASLKKGADTLLVVAPAKTFKRFPKVLGTHLHRLVRELGKGRAPGDKGVTASTLTGKQPRQLVVGVLPDAVSRYNCAARPECVQRVVGNGKIGSGTVSTKPVRGEKKNAILFVLDEPEHLLPTLNAMAKALPLFSRKKGGKATSGALQVLAIDRLGKVLAIDKSVRETVAATRHAARLVDTPPTELNPEAMVREARKLLADVKRVRCRVITGADLLKHKLGGIHAVGRTAIKAPRMLIATYTPVRATKKTQHIALVGKGITYDTGGLSIKSKTGMCGMKCDMGGAAAVLGAFRVLAATNCKHKLSLVLCLAENAVGPDSYKPDDILTMHSGKTVEINNTDAEGRVVLADGASYAARVLKASTILDAATLTGAQCVATGNLHASIISNSADLEQQVVAAGYVSGDLVHPLMFCPEFYKREFRSAVADMRNSVRNRSNAQVSCAAQFIYWHIEDIEVDWCHVDLAGPAFPSDRGTGYGTALLAEVVRNL